MFTSPAPARPTSPFRVIAAAVGVGVATAGCAALSYSLAIQTVVSLWVPSGLLLGILLASSTQRWPAILAGGYLGNVVADLIYVGPPFLTIVAPLANAVEALAAALVVRAVIGDRSPLDSLRGLGALTIGGAAVSNAATAVLGALTLQIGYGRPLSALPEYWLTWWVGDGLGMIVVAPAVVGLLEAVRRIRVTRTRPARFAEGGVLLALVVLTALVTFDRPAGFDRFAASLVFPLLIWIALRVSSGAAAGAVCVFSGIALWFSRHDLGPLVDPALEPLAQAVQVYAFLALLTLSVLIFATALAEREASAVRVRESEEGYRALVETAQDAIVTTDDQGIIQFTNPALHRLLGHEPAALAGRPALDLIAPGHREAVIKAAHAVANEGGSRLPTNAELMVLHRNGPEVPVGIAVGSWMAGGRRKFTAIVHDLTERRHAESHREALQIRLAQSQRLEAIGRLAGGIAHDFNNTLTVILGNAEEALDLSPPDAEAVEHLREIRAAARRSADLVRQLLGFARKQVAAPRVVDVNQHIGDLIGILGRLVGEAAALEWTPAEGVWPIRIDPSQLDQVLTNLCVNARDAVAGGGRITVTTVNRRIGAAEAKADPRLVEGEYVTVTVTDTGHGIEPSALPHLFEPFFTTKPVGEGTGLGLATVHGIVEQNGGFILVDSAPGRGASFHVHLPRHRGQPETGRDSEDYPAGAAVRTTLVVDDEPSIRRLVSAILSRAGYRVHQASGPMEALQVAGTAVEPIDLLVTDVLMPEMNGRDLAAELQGRHPALRVLFTSGYPAGVVEERGALPGDAGFIQKPFTPDALVARVEEVLARQ